MYFRKYLSIVLFMAAALFYISTTVAHAATLALIPETKNIGMGQEFNVDIKVNTEEASINAVQALVKFPNDKLTLVSVDRKDSVFNFWVEEPAISNEDGTLRFIGGTTKGITGSSLEVLRIKFKATGAGSAEIAASEAVVTASDGKGTNVLSTIEGTTIVVGTNIVGARSVTPEQGGNSSPAIPKAVVLPVEQPKKVAREAIVTTALPLKPNLQVSLYPDQSLWYSQVGELTALWEVPPDVVAVATKLDNNPNTKPWELEKEFFTGKSFGVLKEGVWYIHVRFKNNLGLGETAHYKISLDTTPPLPFDLQIDNPVSDNPTPEIRFSTQDSLSGIAEAHIFVDGKGPATTTASSMKLSPPGPGKHIVIARVLDRAGNGVQGSLGFEILPLATPSVDFVTKTVVQGEIIFASGKSIPNTFVDARVLDGALREVLKSSVPSDSAGNWKVIIDKPLPAEGYTISVVARDKRGATSFPTKEESFKVRPKTILSLGFIDLGWFEIFLIAMIVITSGAGFALWWYFSRKNTREAYKIIVGRDIEKSSTILSSSLKELENAQELHDPRRSTKATVLIERMKETIAKMKKYIGEEVKKLK